MKFFSSMKKHLKKKSKGSALIYVIFVFLFTTFAMLLLSNYFQNNIRQATRQQKSLQAHFIALSGSEMAVNALLQPPGVNSVTSKLVDEFRDNPNKAPLSQTLNINDGTVDITVKVIPTADSPDASFTWVQVVSTAKVTYYNGDIVTSISKVDINATDPRVVRWH